MNDTNKEQIIESLKHFVETDFWPRRKGIDEPVLLRMKEPFGQWEEDEIFLTCREEGFKRNQILTSAMRQRVAKERPFAVSVIAEIREATDDPHAHYDRVMATLEFRDDNGPSSIALYWRLGLDDCALEYMGVGGTKMVTLGNLYSGADDCIDHWVYAKRPGTGLTLLFQGGSLRASPMSVADIKAQTYLWLCNQFQRRLDKKKVYKSLVVSYQPLEPSQGNDEKSRSLP